MRIATSADRRGQITVPNDRIMLKNYLVIAVRKLRRERGFALVNVFGLALGMAVCIVVILLVIDQWSYDRFHEEHDRIVRIVADRTTRGEQVALAATPAWLGPALERELPYVEKSLRIGQIRADVEANAKAFALEGLAAENSFFELFDFELIAGDPSTALVGPGKVVLSDVTAERFFGTADPIGEAVEIRGYGGPYTVSGVVRTTGVNSHLRFGLLASFATLRTVPDWTERVDAEENYWNFATYVLLRERASADLLKESLAEYSRTFGDTRYDLVVQPLTSITLGPSYANEIAAYNLPGIVVWMLAGLGLLVMLAAGFNYVSLATAQSIQRLKEVGVRKSVGARRRQVAAQFLTESVVVSLVALVAAVLLVSVFLPLFNSMSFLQRLNIDLSLGSAPLPRMLSISVVFSVVVGLLAGAYPAARVSGFRPVWILKGQLGGRAGSAGRLRKGLAFVQLVIALTAIVTTVLLVRQFEHMLSADLGFRSAGVVTVALQGNDFALLRDELERHAGVEGVAAIARLPATTGSSQTLFVHDDDSLVAEQIGISPGALSVLEISILEGQDFQDGDPAGIIITQTLARRLGFETDLEAVGKFVWTGMTGRDLQPILGVARDFMPDAFGGVGPVFFYYSPDALSDGHAILQVRSGQEMAVLAHVEQTWARLDAAHEFQGGFYDHQIRGNASFRVFRDMMRIVGFVAVLALVIACLGLLAMSAYSAARRTKEIGIRKVLGAGVANLVWLLSREFVLLLGAAAVVGLPLAYIGNTMWLQNFAQHVDLGVGILSSGFAIVAVLVIAAVGSQALYGALRDPAESLRYE